MIRSNRVVWSAALVALAFAFTAVCAQATTVERMSVERLTDGADLVFVGTVQKADARWSDDGSAIFTFVTFDRLDVVKGNYADEILVARMTGGTVDGKTVQVVGAPEFEPGGRYLVFLAGNNARACPVVGLTQGMFRVVEAKEGGEPTVQDAAGRFVVGIADGFAIATESNDDESTTKALSLEDLIALVRARAVVNPPEEAQTFSYTEYITGR